MPTKSRVGCTGDIVSCGHLLIRMGDIVPGAEKLFDEYGLPLVATASHLLIDSKLVVQDVELSSWLLLSFSCLSGLFPSASCPVDC